MKKPELQICDLASCGKLIKKNGKISCSNRKHKNCILNSKILPQEKDLYKAFIKQVKDKNKAFRLILILRLKKILLATKKEIKKLK